MKLTIKEFAELTNVSIRTLHYYDEINLLKPDEINQENGYRYYSDDALLKMQEILFYKELGFSLQEIKAFILSTDYDKVKALEKQKELLLLKKVKLEKMIVLIDDLKEGKEVNMHNLNKDYEKAKDEYKDEVLNRWGETEAFKEQQSKTKNYTKTDWNNISNKMNDIMLQFSILLKNGFNESDKKALNLAKILQDYITKTQYTCTDEILLSLGEMYETDERFKMNIDKNGLGTAVYINKVIKVYLKTK